MTMLWELLKFTEGYAIVDTQNTEEGAIGGCVEDIDYPEDWLDREVVSVRTEEGVLCITLEEGEENAADE